MKEKDKRERPKREPAEAEIRLNRFIANCGVCSRRDADHLIEDGHISVNGKVVRDMGIKITPADEVHYKGKKLTTDKKVYILMNKPKGFVTTTKDPHAERTVMDIIGYIGPERLFPVGRLDKSTTGLLMITNDGDLASRLTHPKYNKRKVYHVWLDRNVSKNDLITITEGVMIGEKESVAADAASFPDQEDRSQVGIELHSGQYRVVRRIFETLGYRVKKLDRVYYAGLTKKNLPRGKWRFLTDQEVSVLKKGNYS
ncbi:MAG: rRNA pseudouridine synthase [Bacteroidales bacterium]|nr:rRNA pseudouridine synthase [Bacteroidales bacterium]